MKRSIYKVILVFICLIFTIGFCSCDFDESRNNFIGGELLDNEKLSEIRDSIFTEESNIDTTEEVEDLEENKDSSQSNDSESEKNSESIIESEVENNSQSEQNNTESEELVESETVDKSKLVYWTKGGSRWHLFIDCYHIKDSENIISGTEEEAIEAKKEKVCSNCAKKAESD
jgi:hypothetical protein